MRPHLNLLRFALLGVGTAALGFVVWISLRTPYPPADWLTVEAPKLAEVGRPFPLRVTLKSPSTAGVLMADLHWSASTHDPRGFLSSSLTPQSVGTAGGVLQFEIPVPARPELKYVRAIVFIGTTARWRDRQRAIETELVPVVPVGEASAGTELQPLQVYENLSDPAVRFREVTWGRPMIAALWFTAGVLAWRGERRRGSQSGAAPERFEFARHWISFACWAAALFEVSKADVHLSDWLRAYAFELRIYRERRWVQQLATVAVGGGGAVIGWLALWRIQSTSRSIVLLCLVAFAACSLARLFSLHQLDQTLAFAVGPVTLGPAAKLALAATAALVFWPRRGPKDHE